MSRPDLRETLYLRDTYHLRKLLALIPGADRQVRRKDEVVNSLLRHLLGPKLLELWNRLGPLEKSAVAEAVHSPDGTFHSVVFDAKYRGSPDFKSAEVRGWDDQPTLMGLFMHKTLYRVPFVPRELREKLLEFVPKPAAAQLASMEEVPERAPRVWKSHGLAAASRSLEVRLTQRLTEQAAIQDLRTVLRLIDQERISVSDTTLLPSKASMTLLSGLLRDGDFFEPSEKMNKWDPDIGPIKAFSWPLLVQAARLASLRNGKLTLTKLGRKALEQPPADVLRDTWNAWIDNGLIDEFSRIDTIKGQKGKGRSSFTPPVERREIINDALVECPVGRWVETAEFSRFMQAADFWFDVTHDEWGLYLCDPQYGSLGYEGYGGWNIVQERYLLCLLFEYAAPLGIIDIAYEHPAGARDDYAGNWGADSLIFLSRYDGLMYFRVTPMGAFILGRVETYEPSRAAPKASLSVLPKLRIRHDGGDLSPDELLLLESFADRETDRLWSLSESKAIQAIEKGGRVSELRALLSACDPQPLPETVDAFLISVEQRGAACVCKGTCLWIECASPQIAEIIARDRRAGALCQRTGDRGLIIPVDKQEAFRKAIRALGFGMPQT